MALIALGISGGIGAYKAVEVARGLQQRGHDVVAVMTRNARRFVGPLTFEAITRRPVVTSQWTRGTNADIEHVSLAGSIGLLLVAPATANVIGKFAGGIADDFLSALYLATKAPVMIAPAMNTHMLEHPAVAANLRTLASRGVAIIEPGAGYLACGWVGKGRLAEPADIVDAADAALTPRRTLEGRHALITAGPTFEDLDPVRFIGNRSSGRMGLAVAAEAMRRGARVTLVTGPIALDAPRVDEHVRIRSAADMYEAVLSRVSSADVVVMAAAVADYQPDAPSAAKITKTPDDLVLTLRRTPDILAALGAWRAERNLAVPVLVGFAAETGDPVPRAREKLVAKRVDLVVANDVLQAGAGFEVDTNVVTLVGPDWADPLPLQPKSAVAAAILDRVEPLLRQAPPPGRPVSTRHA